MKMIRRSEIKESVTYHRNFRWRDAIGHGFSGFSFPCNEEGEVNRGDMCGAALDNLDACLSGKKDVVPDGVERREHTWREPAVGLCDCGQEVELGNFTNTCECGRDYNSGGQLLAPRENWGSETGEHWSDIVRVDLDDRGDW